MKKILLTRGFYAMVDDDDFKRISNWKWTALVRKWPYSPYAFRREMHKTIYLHRFIVNAPNGKDVDHIDGDGLNCQKENMRICTHAENQHNYKKCKTKTSSKFKGVCFDPLRNLWAARIKFHGMTISLGRFNTEEQAAHIYDKAAVLRFGKYARLNFPYVGVGYTRQLFRLGLAWS